MINIDTSSMAHFFASKNHINLCRLHVYSCHIYVVTLKCILSHWSCIFIKPLNVSNALYPFPISFDVITEHIFIPEPSLSCTKGIFPLRCSTITPMLSLKVNHKCLINTLVPIISIIWLGIASTSKWYHGIFYLFHVMQMLTTF